MKKIGILNKDISEVIAGLGHMDTITIGDAGLPVPEGTRRIDLAVKKGVPCFFDVLETVLEEYKVQKVTIASEMVDVSPEVFGRIKELFKDVEIELISHDSFKERTKTSRAVIRTGEFTPYANIILESGVVF